MLAVQVNRSYDFQQHFSRGLNPSPPSFYSFDSRAQQMPQMHSFSTLTFEPVVHSPDTFFKSGPQFDTNTVITHACKECRLHHKSCSGGRPCSRCAEKGIVCESVARKKTVRKKASDKQKGIKKAEPTPIVDSRQQVYQSMHELLEQSYIKLYKQERRKNRSSPVNNQ